MNHPAPILFEKIPGVDGHLGLITLNRPQALHALNHEMIIMLHHQLLEWEEADDIKAVLIRATEGRAFCAGGDLRLIYEKHASQDPSLPQFFCDEYRLNYTIFHYSKPYIAFLDGITMGGGAGISLHGSHKIGTEKLVFAMPETGIGYFPDVGATYFLPRLPHGIGFYLGLTGSRLSCDDSLKIQLIDYKMATTQLPLIIQGLAQTAFDEDARLSVSKILNQFHQQPLLSPLIGHKLLISQHFIKHTLEEVISNLKADPSPQSQETLAILGKKSPTSLKVTLRQLHEGLKRDFDQCMQLEYHLMCHFIQGHDFFEGIRAALISKDQKPLWQPAELSSINQETVDAFFLPLAGAAAQLLFT